MRGDVWQVCGLIQFEQESKIKLKTRGAPLDYYLFQGGSSKTSKANRVCDKVVGLDADSMPDNVMM